MFSKVFRTLSFVGGIFTDNETIKIGFVFGIITLLLGVSVTSSIGISNNDDTTPPETTHTLDPPEPDGNNGWYVSDVNVTITATDDISGVNVTYYRIDGGEWIVYTEPFTLSEEGDDILIEYYSVDNAGNVEEVKSFSVDIDQTKPNLSLNYEVSGGDDLTGYDFWFTATAEDDCSDMDRVEFYLNDKLQETIYGSGPEYWWLLHYPFWCRILGFICDREIEEDYVSFYAIIVGISLIETSITVCACAYDNAGNFYYDEIQSPSPQIIRGIYRFQNIMYPNKYGGYLGRNFIFACFDISNIDW